MSAVGFMGRSLFAQTYQVSIARSALDQARQLGANAVALIDGAAVSPSVQPPPLPQGATISLHA
jgi:hypothetical protein